MGLFKWFQKQSGRDATEVGAAMKRATTPVSAFFLIDSRDAISKCLRELTRLEKYGMPSLNDSAYFKSIREIFESERVVHNFDCDIALHWADREFPAVLRCHSIDAGRYEIELWLPGLIAHDARDMFEDGCKGFFCAFMPPSFYD